MTRADAPFLPSVTACQIINAPASAVFAAWITPNLLEAWWGPEGFTTIVHALEPKEGGRFVFEMITADGTASWTAGHYQKIIHPKRLVLAFSQHCNTHLPDSVAPQMAPSIVTVDFVETGTATQVTVTHAKLNADYAESARVGWSQALHKLAATTP